MKRRNCAIRLAVFVPGVAASFFPACLLAAGWARPGYFGTMLCDLWREFLIGPIHYWIPVLLGHPSPYDLHPMPGTSTWVYCVCLPLTLAHPLRPHAVTGCITATAFAVWYGWALLILIAFSY